VPAEKEWPDPKSAPGDDVVRLRKVRIRSEGGSTVAAHDIRRPIGIEVHYEVLTSGHILVPNFHFHNAEGVLIFMAHDFHSEWRGRPRPSGEYTSIVWIPGNFLAEGQVVVSAAVCSYVPSHMVHSFERHAIAFQVIDSHDGDSARGDYTGPFQGIVRPVLKWTTRFQSCAAYSDTSVTNTITELSGREG
jgi:lipopolysaccharide transport system ATP-binding protein